MSIAGQNEFSFGLVGTPTIASVEPEQIIPSFDNDQELTALRPISTGNESKADVFEFSRIVSLI